jgi:dihydroorotate dehydrogenase
MFTLLRPLLFSLDPELSHDLSIAALSCYGRAPGRIRALTGAGRAGQPVTLLGLRFPNRLGLAAGLDKDAQALEGLARLGFGFIEVGTVTPRPQPGNPKPRLFRLAAEQGIINRMGFNNQGVTAMARRLADVRRRNRLGSTLVGVNVGKNKDTPLESAADDYTHCMRAIYQFADYLTLNLSSPNTPGLRQLQSGEDLDRLLNAVSVCRDELSVTHGRRVPLLVKVAPDLHSDDVVTTAHALLAHGIDGVIATNTTITRPGLEDHPLAAQAGGLSGVPLQPLAQAKVREFRAALGDDVPLIGVGGITDLAAGEAMFAAGADLLQIYSGFIYHGPQLIHTLIAGGHDRGG